ncbi:hypothetical protein AB4406_25965, partial [Vibrio splendidus]
VEPYAPLNFSSSEVSIELNRVFSFSEVAVQKADDTVILSEDFVSLVRERFLSSTPVDLLSAAVVCMHNCPLVSLDKIDICDVFKKYFYISEEICD